MVHNGIPATDNGGCKETADSNKGKNSIEAKELETGEQPSAKDTAEHGEDSATQAEDIESEIREILSSIMAEDSSERTSFHDIFDDRDDRNDCSIQHGRATVAFEDLSDLTSFILENETETFKVSINMGTILQTTSCNVNDDIYIIGHYSHRGCVAEIVCSDDFFQMFDNISDAKEKLNTMKEYLKLSAGQQSNIRQQLMGRKYGISNNDDTARFKELNQLRLKFEICRETYTHQQQRDIRNLFDECRGIRKGERSLLKLKYILNIAPTTSTRLIPDRKTILKTLNKRLYKLDKVKEEIVEAIIASKYSQDHGLRILLVGNPGTGKTTIIEAIAEAYKLPFEIIPLNGANSALEIKGTDSSYEGSDAGKLLKTFYQLGTTEAIIGLDEIDKMASGGKDGNPADALLDTLSDEHVCHDAFLETYVDTRNTIYIATANSTQNIPDFLLNRFKVIVVDDYEDEDKVVIARDYVIPQMLELYDLTSEDIEFPDTTLSYMVKRFCSDSGARMLKDNIHSIIRRIINCWDEAGEKRKVVVDNAMIDDRLAPVTDMNDSRLRYHRHKELFSKPIRDEVKRGFGVLQDTNTDRHMKEVISRKIEYLTSIIPEGGGFETFNKAVFNDCVSNTHYGLTSVKEKVAKSFYAKSLKKKGFSSERILLVGGAGVGKTSICKSIAKGLGVAYIKISLNGVADTHTIKGFEPTYAGSDAGVIVRELAKAGTNRVLIQLDEIDKLGRHNGVNASNALLDLLDNSSEFTDAFLGVPIDLSNVLFIATANDQAKMEPWLLDRFSVIQLDGYTYTDKEQILDNYLLPKLESEYIEAGIKFSISKDAKRLLLKDYCTSFGVRDLEKAIEKITNDLLYETADEHFVRIKARNVIESLGPKPIPRGNLLKKNVPGFSKALAVSGNNSGMSFSIESVIIPSDNSTCITGLPKESAIDSVKLAKTYIRTHYLPDCTDFGVHLHFGEGAVVKDGPSAGVAIMMSMLSAVFNTSINGNVAYTGEIDLLGNVFAIGGTLAKIQAAEQSGCTKVFIPRDNFNQLSDSDIEQFSIEIVPVEHVSEVVNTVLPSINAGNRSLQH